MKTICLIACLLETLRRGMRRHSPVWSNDDPLCTLFTVFAYLHVISEQGRDSDASQHTHDRCKYQHETNHDTSKVDARHAVQNNEDVLVCQLVEAKVETNWKQREQRLESHTVMLDITCSHLNPVYPSSLQSVLFIHPFICPSIHLSTTHTYRGDKGENLILPRQLYVLATNGGHIIQVSTSELLWRLVLWDVSLTLLPYVRKKNTIKVQMNWSLVVWNVWSDYTSWLAHYTPSQNSCKNISNTNPEYRKRRISAQFKTTQFQEFGPFVCNNLCDFITRNHWLWREDKRCVGFIRVTGRDRKILSLQ